MHISVLHKLVARLLLFLLTGLNRKSELVTMVIGSMVHLEVVIESVCPSVHTDVCLILQQMLLRNDKVVTFIHKASSVIN